MFAGPDLAQHLDSLMLETSGFETTVRPTVQWFCYATHHHEKNIFLVNSLDAV